MVYPNYRSPAVEPSRLYRHNASAALLRAAALLDTPPLDGKRAGEHAGAVGSMDADCDGGYLCLVAASGGAAVSGDVPCAMGAFALPAATCANGALL